MSRLAVWAVGVTLALATAVQAASPARDWEAEAIDALETEAALLIELGALAEPLPPALRDVHHRWQVVSTERQRAELLQRLRETEAAGLAARRGLVQEGRRLSYPVADVLGSLRPADLDALHSGGMIRLPAFVYRDALYDLAQRGGVSPMHERHGGPSGARPGPSRLPLGPAAPPFEGAGPPFSPPGPRSEGLAVSPAAIEPQPTSAAPRPLRTTPRTGEGSAKIVAPIPASESTQLPLTLAFVAVVVSVLTALVGAWRLVARVRAGPDDEASMHQVLEAGRRVTRALDPSEVPAIAVEEALRITDARHGAFLTVNERRIEIAHASKPGWLEPGELAGGALSRVAETGQTLHQVSQNEPGISILPAALLATAVMDGGVVRGILLVVREARRPFPAASARALTQFSPMVGTAREVAERHGRVAEMAVIDELTGTMNRRRLDTDLHDVLAANEGQTGFVMVDVDHFKAFNDTFGHGAGDEALRVVAAAIKCAVREEDRVYRYGGEEFSILLPNATAAEARSVAERVRIAVEEASRAMGDGQARVTVSAGCASAVGGSADTLIEAADQALYLAKQAGRNRVLAASG